MKSIYLAITYNKHFGVVKNAVTGCGFEIKINGKRQICHVLETVLKTNNFVVFKFVNNSSNIRTGINMIRKVFRGQAKYLLQ